MAVADELALIGHLFAALCFTSRLFMKFIDIQFARHLN